MGAGWVDAEESEGDGSVCNTEQITAKIGCIR